MNDDRVIEFERTLWVGEEDVYRERVSPDCVMVVPEQPFLLRGEQAIESVEATPRWTEVEFADFEIKRPQEGLIVIGYRVEASRGDERYQAYCTSTYQRQGENDWLVIQHQQTPQVQARSESGSTGVEEEAGSESGTGGGVQQEAGSESTINGGVQEQAARERETERGYQ